MELPNINSNVEILDIDKENTKVFDKNSNIDNKKDEPILFYKKNKFNNKKVSFCLTSNDIYYSNNHNRANYLFNISIKI